MRYGTEHKQATRQRIIETAGRRLKRDGIDGSGVATLMADAGLTNGAFYAHFPSKDDLVATAVADQLREQRESLSAVAPGRAGVEQYVREYLSVQHRDNPGDGCPSAALLDEIGRCTDATRQAYTDGLLAVIDDVAARLAPHDPPSARVQDAQRLRPDGRDTAALPRPGRPAARRRGPRPGHPERPGAAERRATALTRRTTRP